MDDKARAKWLAPKLRRISRMWPPASEAMRLARVGPNRYKCAVCSGHYKREDMHRDHIEPVVPIEGLISTTQLIERMFCPVENYQALCVTCHKEKSAKEAGERAAWRKKSKATLSK